MGEQVVELNEVLHWIPDARLITQFIHQHEGDVILALKAGGKLVGVREITQPNEVLGRNEETDLTFVLDLYKDRASMLEEGL